MRRHVRVLLMTSYRKHGRTVALYLMVRNKEDKLIWRTVKIEWDVCFYFMGQAEFYAMSRNYLSITLIT